ncbi:MAG: hypothetical protein BM555_05015 [Crocinitomix sp. MedPE-SWsnd]|nr:MAG: hypothetical protein BM555_05015 [Crocinitomix sp. MedPE-SWsnd]
MILNWGLISLGFGMGTFKFLFSHWLAYAAADPTFFDIIQIFIATTVGAWFSMSIFYWSSGILMRRAAKKREEKLKWAADNGIEVKKKKTFTRMNKTIVWIKMKIGIFGVTLIAPLFLSIPIGSIVCAKFFGDQKKTFPLMLLNTALYSALMCLWIYATQ